MIDCFGSAKAVALMFTYNSSSEVVGNTVEFGMFRIAQFDVVAFPPRECAF